MTEAPVIRTERLTLRPHRRADFGAYAAMFATDRAAFMGGPIDERGAWANFCKDVAQWALFGHGAWAVDLTETGAFIGQVGLNGHPYFPELELGWLVLPEGEGKGVAREAAEAARDWAWDALKAPSLVSYIHTGNARSIALAERLGAARDPEAAPCPYADHGVWRHPNPEAPR